MVLGLLQITSGFAQKVSLSEEKAPLNKVFDKINRQTGYDFLLSTEDLRLSKPVTINVKNEELNSALNQIFLNQPLSFAIQDKTVIISKKKLNESVQGQPTFLVTGRVVDFKNLPLPGATVILKGSTKGAITDDKGMFSLADLPSEGLLTVSFISFRTKDVSYNAASIMPLAIVLEEATSAMNEVQVIGYGQTTKKLNTGSQSTLTSADIDKQPVTNVLSALSGRAPGVFVQTTNGLPGGNVAIQIRGKGSVLAGTNPLYIIDGVPLGTTIGGTFNSTGGNLSLTASGPISPLNSLNPDDIESITILKDADATAIYGSRASNGVVLIMTKKGKSGKTKVEVNFNQGISSATNLPKLLNLQQYLEIRNEANRNDGITPSADPSSDSYAPDLTVWGADKSTDWAKYILGHTGHSSDGNVTITGGNENTNFNIGANFRTESSYLAGSSRYQRGGLHFTLQHTSPDKKFFLQFSNSLVLDDNRLANPLNISTDIILPPNYPLYDVAGNYNWFSVNPAAELLASAKSTTDNIVENLLMSYKVIPDLTLKVSGGLNQINLKQTQLFPSASLYPGSENYANFGNNSNRTFLVEPQLSYNHQFSGSLLNLLLGGTYQSTIAKGEFINANNFTNELLMNDYSSAKTFSLLNSYTQYKYGSVFGRATYNIAEKYVLNATVRRDGSSRFGPGNQFGNFGSVGVVWIFSEERFFKNKLPFISFGKLRASYGLTGNDQITDYQYLATYGSSGYMYQSIPGLTPRRIANADFHWETTRKIDVGLELGFFDNRLLATVDYYRNRSDDQLVSYKIPYLSGFSTYQANLPAVVENKGWELELNSKNIRHGNFSWSSTINFTVPSNKLLSFENFATSSYSQTLTLGYDITRIYGYKFLSVDPATGDAVYAGSDGTPSTSPYFFSTIGKRTPDFYGGVGNTLTYGKWQLDVFGQFARQKLTGGIAYPPGLMLNSYAPVLSRWQQPGDVTNIPRATNYPDGNYANSSANYFEASYFRLKNVMLSYTLKNSVFLGSGISSLRLYFQGQNLATFWHHNAALVDPESGALSSATPNLPPVKSFVIGLQLTL